MIVYHQILEEAPRTLVPEKTPEKMIKNSKRPLNTSLARRNTSNCKESYQIRNGRYLAKRETNLNRTNFPPIKQHSTNFTKSHNPKLAS